MTIDIVEITGSLRSNPAFQETVVRCAEAGLAVPARSADCRGICKQEQRLSPALVDQGEPVLARVNRGVFSVNNPNNQNPDQKQDQQREKPQDQQQNQTQKPSQPKQPSEKPDPVGG